MATIAIFRGKGWKIAVAATVTLLLALAVFALDASPAFASGTVNVSVQGKGDVSGTGINCNESGGPDCSEFYDDVVVGTGECDQSKPPICEQITEPPQVTFTAGPDRNGYALDGWTGCDTVTGRDCTVTVTASRGVTARFRDAQAPSVSNLSPSSGVQRGTITLSASASDNSGSVVRVEFRVRGVLVATDPSAPYSTSFNTATVADGPAEIRATAFDAANNSSSITSTVTIDNTPPTLTITGGPDGRAFGPGTTQNWTFSAGDANLASVQCSVVPTGSAPSYGPCSGGNSSHSVANKPEGDYTFTVRARDNGGLETTQTRSFSIDATPPNTTITGGPAEGSFTNQTSATFNFTSTETGSTYDCRVYPAGTTPGAFGACSGNETHTASGLASGNYTFEVRATDAVGNTDASPARRTWTVDTIAPETTITSGPNGPTSNNKPTFDFGGSDNTSAAGNLVYAHKVVPNGVAEGSVDYSNYSASTSVTLGGASVLSDGGYTIFVKSRDQAGNEDQSPDQRSFTVDATAPGGTVSINGGAEFASNASVTLTLSATDSSPGSGLTSMRFSNDGIAWSDWEPYATTKAWTLTSGDGTKTVHVQYRDNVGNVSATAQDAIQVDTVRPETTINAGSGPSGTVTNNSANFVFSSNEANATFECKLDGADFAPCSSPRNYGPLAEGTHTFQVKAVDAAGNVDATPASRTWTVDTTRPQGTIDSGPSATTMNGPSATFTFSSNEADSTFICSLDGEDFVSCSSPKSYSNLASGWHSFLLYATDAAGNTDATWASHSWRVDADAPETTINAATGPSGVVGSTSASFSFSSADSDVDHFECKLDSAAEFTRCSSPMNYSGLADGSHTFRVRAVDAFGNTDSSPASRTWTVDVTKPTVTDVAPGDLATGVAPTTSVRATFSEGMKPGTLVTTPTDPANPNVGTSTTFTLRKEGTSTPVTATVTYDQGTNQATLDPSTGLESGVTYRATVTTGVTDAVGNPLATNKVWSFTVDDTTAPTVTSFRPTGKRVSPTAKPTVTFSEKMDEASVEAKNASGLPTTFTLKKGATVLPATVAYTETTTGQYQAVLTPNKRLRSGATYTATVTTAAKDAAGNALAVPKTWKFTVK